MDAGIPTPPYDEQGLKNHQHAVSRKSLSSSPPSVFSSMSSVASSRTAKGTSGSGSHTNGASAPGHPHHHNSHRASKRSGPSPPSSHAHHSTTAHSHGSPSHDGDGRHKRVWKACERCRMKKTKCDGEFPCKRCKDDGLVCTAGTRKKTEYKQLPKGYAEVLENTQFALVSTVHKLYAMLRSGQAWDLGEPELNERGQPVIHSIASKLGCIRPNNDPDLPVGSSLFPETEQDLNELASQLEDYQKKREAEQQVVAAAAAATATATLPVAIPAPIAATTSASATAPGAMSASAPVVVTAGNHLDMGLGNRFDRASSSEDPDGLSDMDDYRKNVFGSVAGTGSSVHSASTTMSPQSMTFNEFDGVSDGLHAPSPTLSQNQFTTWIAQTGRMDMGAASLQHAQAHLQMQQQLAQQQQQRQLSQQLQHQHQQQQKRRQLQQQQQQRQRQQQLGFKQRSLSVMIPPSLPASSVPLSSSYITDEMLRQGLIESNFGVITPHIVSSETHDMMLGTSDPMIYDGSYEDTLI